jgi:O-acetyl-ADP-ribose deacetylase (regulator of RNase III)
MAIVSVAQGNLLKMFRHRAFSAIAHGCNCFHVMGAGVAGQIAREFPEAYEADLGTMRGYSMKLGKYSDVMTEYGRIINMYTQYRPGAENPRLLNDSIERCFKRADDEFGGDPAYLLGIPMIGSGIAGGDWNYISDIINESTPRLNIVVVEYKP